MTPGHQNKSFDPYSQIEVPYAWRVVVISNVRLHEDGLVHSLSSDPTVKVVGSGTPRDIVETLLDLSADVALIDVRSVTDVGLVRRLLDQAPQMKVLALGLLDSDIEAGWMEAGISGCLPSNASREDLVRAISQSARGLFSCTPEMTALLFKRLADVRASPPSPDGPLAQLTAREQDVLLLLERGLSNKEIARKLFICSATVKNHVHSILNKLNLRRRSEVPSHLRQARAVNPRHDMFPSSPGEPRSLQPVELYGR